MCRTSAGTRTELTTLDVTTGSVGVSTAAEQERLRPASRPQNRRGRANPEEHQRDRHRQDDRPGHRAPVHAQELALDEEPVGEQRQDQRDLDQMDDPGSFGSTLTAPARREADAESDRRTEIERTVPFRTPDRPAGDCEKAAEDQNRSSEADVHRLLIHDQGPLAILPPRD